MSDDAYDPDEDLTDEEIEAIWNGAEEVVLVSPATLLLSGNSNRAATRVGLGSTFQYNFPPTLGRGVAPPLSTSQS